MNRWLDPAIVDSDSLKSLGLHPLVAQTLIRRGITTPDSARAFLDPLHSQPVPASALPGMDAALERILSALRLRESICIWGDFDVDGQTSTTLLVQALQSLGANVTYYIPIRGKESHGVHIESLKPIIDNGAQLIVTCDTGISAHEAIDRANSRGVDVVVTDHHDLGETLPNARAIVNPKLLPADHSLANLAGVGVAYKLAEALLIENRKSEIENLLDLVALGLIADVALLKGETRSLAQKGIQALRRTKRLGLKVMAELSGTNLETLTEETIGFTFAPRLNALGRLSDANPAVELLITNDPARARVLAAQIEGLNAQRRLLTSQVYEAAEAQLREHPELLTEPAIVLSNPNWPGGVVGIVANRLVDRYHKPALLLTESEDGILRGSARSVEGLHITEAISANGDLLINFGGHPMAAGISLKMENLAAFRKGLGRAIVKQLGEIVREEPRLQIDAWLGLDDIDLELAEALESLAPFGAGNPSLTLATRRLKMKSVSAIGRGKEHLKLWVEDESGNVRDLLWWNGTEDELPEEGSKFDIAYSLRASTFRGEKQVTLRFEEFRVVEEKPVEVKPRRIEIRDYRSDAVTANARESILAKLMEQNPALQIWAEGGEKSKGRSRFELQRAEEFVIYTTPPSPVDLRKALDIVRPAIIYILAVPPPEEKTEGFLNRLTGLCKFAINRRGGKAAIEELAAATAQRDGAVRLGLEWLAAGGHISIGAEGDAMVLSTGNGEPDQYLQRELHIALQGILQETAAYRAYFARTKKDGILDS